MKKSILGAVTLVLALLGFAVMQPAHANPLVDPTTRGSLTIVKHTGDPLTQFGDPSNPLADPNREPIPEVVFGIQKIENINLGSNEGWREAQALIIDDLYTGGARAGDLGPVIEATTDEDGRAVFTDLEIGAYYVTEQPSDADRRGVTDARPFIVTIPQTSDNGTSWNYDVVVQAKDQLLKVTHQAGKTCFAAGEPIDYGVSATVPPLNLEGEITRYELYVPLPDDFSAPSENTVVVTRTGDPEDDDPNNRVELDADDFEVSFPDGVARLVLKESGLEKVAQMRDGNPAAHVTWLFETTPSAQETIVTKAYLLVEGYPEFDPNERYGVASNEVTLRSCPAPDDVPIPVPVPTPGFDPELFPGTSVVPQPAPTTAVETTAPGTKGLFNNLASTGANVIWVVVIGLVMILLGVLLRRNNKGSA